MDEFEVSVELPVGVEELYAAWLNSEEHAAFTGSKAVIDPRAGGKFTAWDGYIEGETLELDANRRILQSWRTVEFAEDAPDSKIEVVFEDVEGGAKLTLRHSSLQPGDGEKYAKGWEESYFVPMRAYYAEKAE